MQISKRYIASFLLLALSITIVPKELWHELVYLHHSHSHDASHYCSHESEAEIKPTGTVCVMLRFEALIYTPGNLFSLTVSEQPVGEPLIQPIALGSVESFQHIQLRAPPVTTTLFL